MIRKFSKCGNTLERIMLLRSEEARECSMEELQAICTIMSFHPADMGKEQLLGAMVRELEDRALSEALELNGSFGDIDELEQQQKKGNTQGTALEAWAREMLKGLGVEVDA